MKINIQLIVNRTIQILLAYLFVANISYSFFAPIFAVFITNTLEGATLATIGFAIAIYSVVKSIVQIPTSRILDKKAGELDDFYAMIAGSFLSIIYVFALLFMTKPWHLYGLEVLSGLSDGLIMAAYYSIFSNHIDRKAQAFEWSLLSVGGLTISVAIGSALGGLIAEHLGFYSFIIIAGTLNACATLILFLVRPYLKTKRR